MTKIVQVPVTTVSVRNFYFNPKNGAENISVFVINLLVQNKEAGSEFEEG